MKSTFTNDGPAHATWSAVTRGSSAKPSPASAEELAQWVRAVIDELAGVR